MNALARRLARLERQLVPQGCPACGAGGSGPLRFRMVTAARVPTERAPWGPTEPVADDPCSTCGARPLHFTITLGETELHEG